jgi:hypothetical protein
MIVVERLNPSEWDLLKSVDDGFTPNVDHSIAVVARNESQIIGRLFAVAPIHVEGVFVEPRYRGGTLFKDMMSAMELELKAEKVNKVFAYSVRPEIGHYIEQRCGYSPLAWKIYSKELTCPQR